MGEYIMDPPNTERVMSADVIAFFAKVTGYPAEKITRAMFLVDVEDVVDEDGQPVVGGGIAFGGNMDEAGMLALAVEAAETLYRALRYQALADMVPDDLSGLEAA